jgi:acetolactate synthase small subunit
MEEKTYVGMPASDLTAEVSLLVDDVGRLCRLLGLSGRREYEPLYKPIVYGTTDQRVAEIHRLVHGSRQDLELVTNAVREIVTVLGDTN